jgi:hypothetical protein
MPRELPCRHTRQINGDRCRTGIFEPTPTAKDLVMAKGQKRSNREPKKPKQPKAVRAGLVSAPAPAPIPRDTASRDRAATRVGRR